MPKTKIEYEQCATDGCDGEATSLEHSVCRKCYSIIKRLADKDKTKLNVRASQLQRANGCLHYFTTNVTGKKRISLPVWPGQVLAKNVKRRRRFS